MPAARDLSLDALLCHLTPTPGGWLADYHGATLRSVFQPVLSITCLLYTSDAADEMD